MHLTMQVSLIMKGQLSNIHVFMASATMISGTWAQCLENYVVGNRGDCISCEYYSPCVAFEQNPQNPGNNFDERNCATKCHGHYQDLIRVTTKDTVTLSSHDSGASNTWWIVAVCALVIIGVFLILGLLYRKGYLRGNRGGSQQQPHVQETGDHVVDISGTPEETSLRLMDDHSTSSGFGSGSSHRTSAADSDNQSSEAGRI